MKLVITNHNNRIICAWYDDRRMVQVDIIDNNDKPVIGNVYIGKVKNIVTNINAVFVDIGIDELCFMQVTERIGNVPAYRRNGQLVKINREDEITVQYVRDGIKTKQPAVSTDITLSGRYLIKTCKNDISISSKIKDKHHRKQLKEWLADCNGYIVRTNAEHISYEQLMSEKDYLEKTYEDIISKAGHSKVYSLVYSAPNEIVSAVRDGYSYELEQIITDDIDIYNELKDYLSIVDAQLVGRLCYYEDTYPLASLYSLETNISNATNRKVWLKSGAYLIIDPTEACTVIDVNSGKSVAGKKNKEETIYKINIEAAEEITRQLRLRNISGIIITDFIDMESEEHKDRLISRLKELADKDPVKTAVVDITKLGLVEMTRRKYKKSIYEQLR